MLGKRRAAKAAAAAAAAGEGAAEEPKKASERQALRYAANAEHAKVDTLLDDQFSTGRLYAILTSRPGQSGRADGYILEGKELEFYLKKIKQKK